MERQPIIGERVKLNSIGFASLRLDSEAAFEQARNMRITQCVNLGTERAPIWSIDVDQPLINRFMLDASMVEATP